MRQPFFKGVVLGAVVASVVLMAGTALAGGVGGVFSLGRTNAVSRTSSLVGTTSGRMLQVTNKGTGQALGLTVKAGTPPLRVNSSGEVANLNADELGGKHASDFVQGGGRLIEGHLDLRYADQGTLLTLPGFGAISFTTSGGYWQANYTDTLTSQSEDVWSQLSDGRVLQTVSPGASVMIGDSSNGDWIPGSLTLVAGDHMATVRIAGIGGGANGGVMTLVRPCASPVNQQIPQGAGRPEALTVRRVREAGTRAGSRRNRCAKLSVCAIATESRHFAPRVGAAGAETFQSGRGASEANGKAPT